MAFVSPTYHRTGETIMAAQPIRIAAIVLAALLAACSGRGDPTMEVATSLQVEVASSTVRLRLYVTNATGEPLAYTFPSGQRYDFWVETASGREVWRWSDGRSFTQAVVRDTLAPGDTWQPEAEWDAGELRGEFSAVGRLTARDRPVEQRVTFELP